MSSPLTIMAVHAHPDDEVISTGGLLARCADDGIRTVLVTCTNGEQGDGPNGVKPGEPGHDPAAVRDRRLAELRASTEILGLDHVELLGYQDSGMEGWDTNHDPKAFWNTPVETAAARLATLIERYRPQVVVTYDENGNYGHPDHIQAHRIAVAATESTGIPDKLYHTAIPRERSVAMFRGMKEAGGMPDGFEIPDDFGTPEALITAFVDVAPYADRKIKALQAHASQSDSAMFMRLPTEVLTSIMSAESFVRVRNQVPGAPDHEDDLFAGLR